MSDELTKVFDKIAEKFGIVVDWTKKDVLPYIQDLMQRYRNLAIAQNIITIIFCVLIVNSCIFLLKHIYKANKKSIFREYDNDVSILGLIAIICCVTAISICIPMIGVTINEVLNWIFVPELQFAEKVAELSK